MYTLDAIGDKSPEIAFTGGEMSCSKMVKTKCGAPTFEVKSGSKSPEAYLVWYLEYGVEHLEWRNQTDPQGLEL